MYTSITILIALLSLLGPVMSSFGGDHDHGHGHDHGGDIHSGHFCWDISKWGEIFYKEVTVEVCDTGFEQKCDNVPKEVTEEVMDTICDLVLYTECKMRREEVEYEKMEEIIEQFEKMDCTMIPEVEHHTKTRPSCHNETKWNCISDWVLNEKGEKVFQKVGTCTPMTWLNCTLEEYTVPFTIMKPNCSASGEVCWKNCTTVPDTKMMTHMECDVKSTTKCEMRPKPVTKTINYQECYESKLGKCTEKKLKIPCQKKIHRKQCLLSEDAEEQQSDTPIGEDEGSVELVRCADDPPGTTDGRLGLLKPQQKDEFQSESNPVPSYGLPSAPAIQGPIQKHQSVDRLYGSPPPIPTQDYDYPLPSYSSQRYQSNYGDEDVPLNTIAKREIAKIQDPNVRFPRTTRLQVPGGL